MTYYGQGPHVDKFTFLIDVLEVTGHVAGWLPEGPTGDGFELAVDPGYLGLTNAVPGSAGQFHCETYPEAISEPGSDGSYQINHAVPFQPWGTTPYVKKPTGQQFRVYDPIGQAHFDLKPGDHIRVRGRLIIENGHPRDPIYVPDLTFPLLRVGQVFLELHPFDWNGIEYVVEPACDSRASSVFALAAPLYETIYGDDAGPSWEANRLAGIAYDLFLGDGARLFHSSVSTAPELKPPPLPPGIDAYRCGLDYSETEIIINSTGKDPSAIRRTTVGVEGLIIGAQIDAAPVEQFGGSTIADFNDPANNKSVFVARYDVGWTSMWVDDELPAGATGDGNDRSMVGVTATPGWDWYPVIPGVTPFSGKRMHGSFSQDEIHQHFFTGAARPLQPKAGDVLFAHVYLLPGHLPAAIMLQWNVAGSWEHRAYWGEDKIPWGTAGSVSRYHAGDLPAAGQWMRIEVAAAAVGVEGADITGMAFSVWGPTVLWDVAGFLRPAKAKEGKEGGLSRKEKNDAKDVKDGWNAPTGDQSLLPAADADVDTF